MATKQVEVCQWECQASRKEEKCILDSKKVINNAEQHGQGHITSNESLWK